MATYWKTRLFKNLNAAQQQKNVAKLGRIQTFTNIPLAVDSIQHGANYAKHTCSQYPWAFVYTLLQMYNEWMPLFFRCHMIVMIKYIALTTILYCIKHGVQCINNIQYVLKFTNCHTLHYASMLAIFVDTITFLNGGKKNHFSLSFTRHVDCWTCANKMVWFASNITCWSLINKYIPLCVRVGLALWHSDPI